jgi:hypothetical protein
MLIDVSTIKRGKELMWPKPDGSTLGYGHDQEFASLDGSLNFGWLESSQIKVRTAALLYLMMLMYLQ